MSGDRIDHAAAAREILDRLTPTRDTGPGLGMGYWSSYEGAQVRALRGVGHALLAIHEELRAGQLERDIVRRVDADVRRRMAETDGGSNPEPCLVCPACLNGVQSQCERIPEDQRP